MQDTSFRSSTPLERDIAALSQQARQLEQAGEPQQAAALAQRAGLLCSAWIGHQSQLGRAIPAPAPNPALPELAAPACTRAHPGMLAGLARLWTRRVPRTPKPPAAQLHAVLAAGLAAACRSADPNLRVYLHQLRALPAELRWYHLHGAAHQAPLPRAAVTHYAQQSQAHAAVLGAALQGCAEAPLRAKLTQRAALLAAAGAYYQTRLQTPEPQPGACRLAERARSQRDLAIQRYELRDIRDDMRHACFYVAADRILRLTPVTGPMAASAPARAFFKERWHNQPAALHQVALALRSRGAAGWAAVQALMPQALRPLPKRTHCWARAHAALPHPGTSRSPPVSYFA